MDIPMYMKSNISAGEQLVAILKIVSSCGRVCWKAVLTTSNLGIILSHDFIAIMITTAKLDRFHIIPESVENLQ